MTLTKFNFSTLIFSALLTFNINADMCVPENDEFDEQISQQEGIDPPIEEDSIPTESEYIEAIDKNLSSTSEETVEILDEAVTETAVITLKSVGEVLTAITVVALLGITAYEIFKVLKAPNTTVMQKVDAITLDVASLIPGVGLVIMIVKDFGLSPGDRARKKIDDSIHAIANEHSYAVVSQEVANLNARILQIEEQLTKTINDTAIATKIRAGIDDMLLRYYSQKYLSSAKKIRDFLPQTYAKQWMEVSPKFISLDAALEGVVKGEERTLPSVISSQTLKLCGVNDTTNFLSFRNKSSGQIKSCLEGIFYDYKAHFSTYSLSDTITISTLDTTKTPNEKVIQDTTLGNFLSSYAKAYNHFLSNIKLIHISGIQKERTRVGREICLKRKTSGIDFLKKSKKELRSMAKTMFQEEHNLNSNNQNKSELCNFKGKYWCAYLKYDPSKDTALLPILSKVDKLRVLIDDAHNDCLEDAHNDKVADVKFIRAMNNDRFYPMLGKNDTAKLFVDLFRGVKSHLMFSVRKKAKIFHESKR
ncbi:hypothetical protein THERMOT_1502 [Bathymodiolus thermophilus thioautotrophic gill symbiont]|uniref:hypothetical protein n=1 Tax=Bathymodiolus thermophilus thioautotrophic gill symbiont TaxID=2360 RepID=UPI00192CB7E2|nr:hypothetical protein [Bathymodiolus thermophilus thioautotrophic gill symbiont]CAB5501816.1 hypothetical protein THERMOT_1502 [Bathymodiolus thermophilus thioautotrophic gill symbiont]